MLLKALALMLGAAEPGIIELSDVRIMELVEPVVKSGIDANELKIHERMVETGRLSVPLPALLLFFNESGCLTAMLGQEDLSKADGKCFEGDKVPTINDFLGGNSVPGKPAIIVLSPLYNLAALNSLNSSQATFLEENRVKLDQLQVEIQQNNPEATVHPVYVPFGM